MIVVGNAFGRPILDELARGRADGADYDVSSLKVLATEYTDTLFFRYAGGLAGGSLREGGHLVEFEL